MEARRLEYAPGSSFITMFEQIPIWVLHDELGLPDHACSAFTVVLLTHDVDAIAGEINESLYQPLVLDFAAKHRGKNSLAVSISAQRSSCVTFIYPASGT